MNSITFGYAYYNAYRGLKNQLELWKSYPEQYKKNIFFIIVDDGSTDKAAPILEPYRDILNISLYEVLEDIPWNDIGSMNLYFKNAETEWVFRTDLDYLLPVECFEEIMNMTLEKDFYYTFASKKITTKENLVQHPGTFLIRKEAFWEAGGCDEDFTGNYGWVDVYLKDCFNRKLKENKMLNLYLYSDDSLAVMAYSRDLTINHRLLINKREGKIPQSNTYLRFNWKKVY